MMTLARSAANVGQWIASNASHDFCPWANKYVYWLKQPIGWFILATICSLLIGTFFSPIGWTLAAGLLAVTLLGLGFPLLALAAIRCELKPVNTELNEGEQSHLTLAVVNRLPIPVLGLMVERFLVAPPPVDGLEEEEKCDCGLARVPALSRASYRLPVQPHYRGHYPVDKPRIACSFPFGIYTARREIQCVAPTVVRPLVLPLVSEIEWGGDRLADVGNGKRHSDHGDFLGVREFRRGDALKSIHWAQSAKQDCLIVCERGGPQRNPIALHLSTYRCRGNNAQEARDHLAWRVRIMASVCELLAFRHLPFVLWIDGKQAVVADRMQGLRKAMQSLTDIPLDSTELRDVAMDRVCQGIFVHARLANGECCTAQEIAFEVRLGGSRSSSSLSSSGLIWLNRDIAEQVAEILRGSQRANFAA